MILGVASHRRYRAFRKACCTAVDCRWLFRTVCGKSRRKSCHFGFLPRIRRRDTLKGLVTFPVLLVEYLMAGVSVSFTTSSTHLITPKRGDYELEMTTKLPIGLPFRLSFQCPRCCSRLPRTSASYQNPQNRQRFSTTRPRPAIAAPEVDFSDLAPPSPAHARIVPASPSYFTGRPQFTDNLLSLQNLLRKYQTLPTVEPGLAPRVAWKTVVQYRLLVGEPVRSARYTLVLRILKRLNHIHPQLMPPELKDQMQIYKRDVDPYANVPNPGVIDEFGRSYGVGRRKSSSAKVFLVQGNGEVLINGKSINTVFGRIHDRESALWALKATGRMDKYNVWALVSGGGTTGQAEAITLGTAKALMVHEPLLKPALRRGKCNAGIVPWTCSNPIIAGCVTRDPRRVERKKPGHVKARKMPAWVKR